MYKDSSRRPEAKFARREMSNTGRLRRRQAVSRSQLPISDADAKISTALAEENKPWLQLGLVPLSLFFYICLITALSFVQLYRLPEALPKDAPSDRFSEFRARELLDNLSVEIGPRIVGSPANEDHAVEMLKSKLYEVREEIHPELEMEIDVQITSGSFQVGYRGVHPIVNSYIRVKNVAARISRKNSPKTHALLLASHFDSMLSSSGASDAAACVAGILESVRAYFSPDSKFELDHESAVIMLFNGAEEFGLQAAHGFISNHAWGKTVTAFINVDSGGVGGKILLTQTGPNHWWIAKAYADAVPYPHGSVMAQDLFQGGAVPSDTDFRIYAEFGGEQSTIPGLDLVWYQNGYLYHTPRDTAQNMPLGSLQVLGENLCALLGNLLKGSKFSKEKRNDLENTKDSTLRAVYYAALFDQFVFCYSHETAALVHSWVLRISVFSIVSVFFISSSQFESIGPKNLIARFYQILRMFLKITSLNVMVYVSSILFPSIFGFLLAYVFQSPMIWFRGEFLVLGIFGSLNMIAVSFGLRFMSKNIKQHLDIYSVTQRLKIRSLLMILMKTSFLICWSVLLYLMNFIELGSSYVALWLCIYTLIDLWGTICMSRFFSLNPSRWPIVYFLLLAISGILTHNFNIITLITLMEFFVPTMGRFGSIPADIVIPSLVSIILFNVFHSLWPWILYIDTEREDPFAPKKTRLTKVSIHRRFETAFFIILSVSLFISFQERVYTEWAPKRLIVQDTYNLGTQELASDPYSQYVPSKTSDLFILSIDNVKIPKFLNLMNCENLLKMSSPIQPIPFGDLDALYPLALNVVSSASVMTHTHPPDDVFELPKLTRSYNNVFQDGSIEIGLKIFAPKSTYGTLRITGELTKWSFSKSEPLAEDKFSSVKTYLVRFICGDDEPYEFQLTFANVSSFENAELRFVASYFIEKTKPLDIVMRELPSEKVAVYFWTSMISNWKLSPGYNFSSIHKEIE